MFLGLEGLLLFVYMADFNESKSNDILCVSISMEMWKEVEFGSEDEENM
jgi:hypothetical protein